MKENTLRIRGEKQQKADEQKGETLYQGIAARAFERVGVRGFYSESGANCNE